MDLYSIYPKQFRNSKIPIEKDRCFVLMPFSEKHDMLYGVIKDTLYKLHGYHKTKDYTKYTKDKKKGIKEYYTTKIIKSQRNRPRQGERNKGTTKQPENN